MKNTFLYKILVVVRDYFIGDALAKERDHLKQANFYIVFYSCFLSLILLIPLQLVYFSKDILEPKQIIIGLLAIAFFIGGLAVLKFQKEYLVVSTVLTGFSVSAFIPELWLYQDYSIVSGIHLCVNFFFAFYVLKRNWRIFFNTLQVLALVVFWYTYYYDISITFLAPIQQPLVERIATVTILIGLLALIINHYKRAHALASNQLKASFAALEKSKVAAEEMNALKSRFLANMSHEIRTPLNGILGISEILKLSANDPETREYIEIQSQSGTRLLNTIDGILNLSRLEAQSDFFKLEDIDLNLIAIEVIQNQQTLAENQNIELRIVASKEPAMVHADDSIMYQAISNLVGNAIKFTNSEGKIEVRVETLESDIKLSVVDTGIGISDEFLERVFQPFERDSNNHSSNHSGTGLGLSITQKFVELMGGCISVESKVNVGTTFKIVLPKLIIESADK